MRFPINNISTIFAFFFVLSIECVSQNARTVFEGTEPAFSPTGKKLAFVYLDNVYISDLNSKSREKLTHLRNCHCPCWSPDGKRLVFASYGYHSDKKETFSIWIVNIDGSELHMLIRTQIKKDKAYDSNLDDQYPRWAPNGKDIVWSHDKQLWISDTTGLNARPLTKVSAKIFEYDASWSTDNKSIAYLRGDTYSSYQIWKMDTRGNFQVRLGLYEISVGHLRSSKNGKALFYDDQSSIFELDWNGASSTPLISNVLIGGYDISPDGKMIAFDDSGPEVDSPKIHLVRIKFNNK
jgi:Tol biopolymer transport system component